MLRLLLFSLLLSAAARSQAPAEFIRLGVNEGLSQNSVYGITQDRQGFLWIATGDGLNRYDGRDFRIFREKSGDTSARYLPGKISNAGLLEDRHERLWFYTDRGLTSFDKRTRRFQVHLPLTDGKAGLISCVDSTDRLWILDNRLGLIAFDTRTGNRRRYAIGQAVSYHTCQSGTDAIFLTTSAGVFRFDLHRHQFSRLSTDTAFVEVLPLKDGRLAMTKGNRLTLYQPNTGAATQLTIGPADSKAIIFHLIEYPTSILYVNLSGSGICRINLATGQQNFYRNEPGNPVSLTNDFILLFYLDRSCNLWIGTEGGGISRLDLKPQKFRSFPAFSVTSQQASNLMVKSVYAEKDHILTGTFDRGLYIVDTATANWRHVSYAKEAVDGSLRSINIIHRDRENRLWMNTGPVIGYVDTPTYRFRQWARLSNGQNFSVYGFCEMADGNFLAGTSGGLLRIYVRADGGVATVSMVGIHPTEAVSGYIQSVGLAPDGTVWIGKNRNGFWHLRLHGDRVDVIDSGLLKNSIRSFLFDGGRVWMAAETGLVVYDTRSRTMHTFDEDAGMANSYVYGLLAESNRSIWMSTNKGISHASFEDNGTVSSIRFANYTQTDRLQSNEFNTGAFHRSATGLMVFGGVNGINWFRPNAFVANHYLPPMALTSIRINERPIDSECSYVPALRVRYDQNTITLRFAALEYTNPGANRYSYWLEGYDKQWIDAGSLNEVRYPNLPPGHYIFHARGSNSDGLWSEQMLNLPIAITPPFWKTTSFRIAIAVTLLLLIALITRYYFALQLKEKIRQLEKERAVNEERVRISRDMHDELGTGLTKIALLSEVTRKKMEASTADGQQLPLQEIFNTSRDLTQRMGEIIWTLNSSNDNLDSLVAYLKEHVGEVCDSLGLDLRTDFPQWLPPGRLSNHKRQQVLLVTKEALHNAVKHAGAATILFKGRLDGGWLQFELSDDGCGFAVSKTEKPVHGRRNGLDNMAWRMERAGGWLQVHSAPGGGTRIQYGIEVDR